MLFQNTIDTTNYMIAGYTIFFSVMTIYVSSLIIRWKKAVVELATLEDLDN